MSLQCGIIGLPNVGKSTLFNCLSNAKLKQLIFRFVPLNLMWSNYCTRRAIE